MPRANIYFLLGHVWHIAHRCHSRITCLNLRLIEPHRLIGFLKPESDMAFVRKKGSRYGILALKSSF